MPLEAMEEVGVRYVASVGEFGTPDAVILPGSKNTMEDLKWLRQCGLEAKITFGMRQPGRRCLESAAATR